jgi:hypothetical protein
MKIRDSNLLPLGALFVEKPYHPNNIADKVTTLMAA